MIKRVHVYDMDGVLVDSSHRYRLDSTGKLDIAHWTENRNRCWYDRILPLMEQYRADLRDPSTHVIIATARNMSFSERIQLELDYGFPDSLISRGVDNLTECSSILKIKGLSDLLSFRIFDNLPVMFWEDNRKILSDVCAAIPRIEGILVDSNQGIWY